MSSFYDLNVMLLIESSRIPANVYGYDIQNYLYTRDRLIMDNTYRLVGDICFRASYKLMSSHRWSSLL